MKFRQTSSIRVFLQYARRHCWALIWVPFVAWTSELQAGLPFRLPPITIISLSTSIERFSIVPAGVDWNHIQDTADLILKDGWTAWSVTRHIYRTQLPT